ncbi:MAG TPA: rhodanese-like domain-containing protein [Kofleriaceae bacterium]
MRTLGLALALLLASACDRTPDHAPDRAPARETVRAPVAELTVDQVDHLLADHACVPVDANGDPLRKRLGVLPGAVLLGDLDAPYRLPADQATQLVFYCANTACDASHYAADKARDLGYARVAVMPAGIAGWVKAGKPIQTL